jgi:serine/threonine-protein kinase
MQGQEIAKGSTVNLKLSVGPQVGMVRVPNLFGQTLSEAEKILKNTFLRVGNKVYIFSQNYLPNTVVDQYPSINTLAKIGDSVTVTLTRTK